MVDDIATARTPTLRLLRQRVPQSSLDSLDNLDSLNRDINHRSPRARQLSRQLPRRPRQAAPRRHPSKAGRSLMRRRASSRKSRNPRAAIVLIGRPTNSLSRLPSQHQQPRQSHLLPSRPQRRQPLPHLVLSMEMGTGTAARRRRAVRPRFRMDTKRPKARLRKLLRLERPRRSAAQEDANRARARATGMRAIPIPGDITRSVRRRRRQKPPRR